MEALAYFPDTPRDYTIADVNLLSSYTQNMYFRLIIIFYDRKMYPLPRNHNVLD